MNERKTEAELRALKSPELRRYAIDNGYGVKFLSSRKKEEIIRIILDVDAVAIARSERGGHPGPFGGPGASPRRT